MMNTKGLKSLLKGLFVGVMIMISSCQQDDNTSTTEQIEAHAPHSAIRTVSAGDIPEIMDFLRTKSNDQLQFTITHDQGVYDGTRSHTDDLSLTTPLLDQIKQVTNGYGKSNYTFKLIEEQAKEGIYFLNLVVKEYGGMLYMYILKYIPSQEWMGTYSGDQSLGNFDGVIYLYTEGGSYLVSMDITQGTSVSSQGRSSDCPPDNNTGGGGSDSDGSGPNDGTSTTNGDDGGGLDIGIGAEFGWRCNHRNVVHPEGPEGCNAPEEGGEWVLIIIDSAFRSMANRTVCPPPDENCQIDCVGNVDPVTCTCVEEDEEVEGTDIPVIMDINPSQILRNRLDIEDGSPKDLLLSDNPHIEGIIFDLLAENSWNDDDLMWVNELLNLLLETGIETFNEFNYPGLDEGLPYEWWKDADFIENSGFFDITPDDPNADDERPNRRELALYAVHPAQAILHVENSTVALDVAHNLAADGIFSQTVPKALNNGKGDAFRHAFWNALGAAEFGSSLMKRFADAHEHGQSGLDVSMDFFNNENGRDITDDNGYDFNTSDTTIQNAVLQSVFDGNLKYISPTNPNGSIIGGTSMLIFTNQ